jgi:K+-sensing histidine kinase KdpD
MSSKIEGFVGNKFKQGEKTKGIELIKNKITNKNQNNIADFIYEISKRVKELDLHLDSLSILSNKTVTDIKNYPLKKILLSFYAPFQDNFINKNIAINFNRVDENINIKLDFKVFSLVMHHFFDNTSKYSKNNDNIDFIFSSDNNLVIKMHSLTIEDIDSIFIQGFSGKNTKNLSGDGIGMYVIKEGLKIMNMDIEVKCGDKLNDDNHYSKNTFIIKCNRD